MCVWVGGGGLVGVGYEGQWRKGLGGWLLYVELIAERLDPKSAAL